MTELFAKSALLLFRIAPIVTLSPAFGGKMIPAKLRLIISVCLTALCYPLISYNSQEHFLLIAACQLVIGIFMAIIASLPFAAVQSVGEWIDINRGETLSQLFLPQLQTRSSSFGRLLLISGIALFFSCGAHHYLLAELFESFSVISLGESYGYFLNEDSSGQLIPLVLDRFNELMKCSLKIGLPVVLILWLTDCVLGLLNRLAPSLQVFYLGIPLKMWLGIVVFASGSRWIVSEFTDLFKSLALFVT